MGPFRSSKAMATGLILLVLLNVATATFSGSFNSSTGVGSVKDDCEISAFMCYGIGFLCASAHDYDQENCCCTLAESKCVLSLCVAAFCRSKTAELPMGTDVQNPKQVE